MARKRRGSKEDKELDPHYELNPETKRGIIAVFLFATAILIILSFFEVAGSLGTFIERLLTSWLGWDRLLLPVVLMVTAAVALYPERGRLNFWNSLGIVLFFFST